jgi:cysteinyl-tRNA synthetase
MLRMALLEIFGYVWMGIIDMGSYIFGGYGKPRHTHTDVILHNTLSDSLEKFIPLRAGVVKMYNCGPTVYGEQHIGNLSMFVFTDILRRTLEFNGYKVQQVINITDVGHLVSDGDEGEDKMTKGLKREKKALTLENMRTLAEKYTEMFLRDLAILNIQTESTKFPRASDYIPAQIAMVKALEEKGYAYTGKSGVYFDTARFREYGKLGNINLEGLKEGARVDASDEKRNPTDFLLWKFDAKLGWESPWGLGFPGWHIECSAMIRSILGDRIDIHTGGIEHIPVHHNNEIAQSESATGKKPFSRYWLHRAHLQLNGGKIAKSGGSLVYLSEILEKGYHPMAFRYLLLGAHYRQPSNFSWESLAAAQTAYLKLRKIVDELPTDGSGFPAPYGTRFTEAVNDDLNTPAALAVVWEMVNDKDIDPANLRSGILHADDVLGLNLAEQDEKAVELYRKKLGQTVSTAEIPDRVKELLAERELARAEKRWDDADAARKNIEGEGYVIEDTGDGPRLLAKF